MLKSYRKCCSNKMPLTTEWNFWFFLPALPRNQPSCSQENSCQAYAVWSLCVHMVWKVGSPLITTSVTTKLDSRAQADRTGSHQVLRVYCMTDRHFLSKNFADFLDVVWAKSKIWFSHQWHLVTTRSAIGPKFGPLYMQHGNQRQMSFLGWILRLKISQIKTLIYFQKLKRLVYSVTYLAWGNHKSLQTTSKTQLPVDCQFPAGFLVFWTMTTARSWTKLVVWFWNSPLLAVFYLN